MQGLKLDRILPKFPSIKTALIVGASSGIGRELALALGEGGYLVGITARRKDLLESIKANNPNHYIISDFDCTHPNALDKLESIKDQLGRIDIFIISAGTGNLNTDLNSSIPEMTNNLNVNAFSSMALWAFSYFKTNGNGHLVAITSIAGLRGGKFAPSYNASKAYQINFFLEGLRQKAVQEKLNITITDIRPGFVDTAMAKGEGQFWVASPKKASQQIVSALQKKKGIVYVTKRWAFIAIILKILPSWFYKRI